MGAIKCILKPTQILSGEGTTNELDTKVFYEYCSKEYGAKHREEYTGVENRVPKMQPQERLLGGRGHALQGEELVQSAARLELLQRVQKNALA